MQADEVEIGMRVRYPRTGTTGRVVALENEMGRVFAELDSTHLRYRVDQLVPAGVAGERSKAGRDDLMDQLKKERDFLSATGFQEAISHTDQSCEGGG
ncbi:MAG: hypothetical protein A4E37_00965 [Methanoregulaceae archaeon PtaB.Bin056]|jgi:hypothetical protein|nr:MAG: hypothetical protein A4E37_00965 [Methanoregulaceae archaeon PtaB.Bin056]